MIYTTKKIGDKTYRVELLPSIFVSRNGKKDIVITKHDPAIKYGMLEDGHYWNTIMRIEAETGNILCEYGRLPVELNIEEIITGINYTQNEI